MEQIIDYRKSYEEYKADLDRELAQTAEGFVRIGYLLKVARDTEVLSGSGYASVTDFAAAEYGLDKSQVSRFININDRFGKDGYSDQLEERYKGFGYAKLVLMLQLPDAINEELTADFTKSEIQAIKEELDEEKKITDLEVLMEGTDAHIAEMETDLDKTIKQLGQDEPELFRAIWEAIRQQSWGKALLQEFMAPAGQKLYSIRIRGTGRKELMLKDAENGDTVVLIDLRSGEKTAETWEELLGVWENLINTGCGEDFKDFWERIYMAECPVKEEKTSEVAPVQPKKQEKRKESKVIKAKTLQKEEPKVEETKEEPIPGRMNVMDYPELIPEGEFREITEEAETAEIQVAEDDLEEETAEDVAEAEETVEDEPGSSPSEKAEQIWEDLKHKGEYVRGFLNVWLRGDLARVPMMALKNSYKEVVAMAAGMEQLINELGGKDE